jgi:hypothetical protein
MSKNKPTPKVEDLIRNHNRKVRAIRAVIVLDMILLTIMLTAAAVICSDLLIRCVKEMVR